jgi:hypothetical protein
MQQQNHFDRRGRRAFFKKAILLGAALFTGVRGRRAAAVPAEPPPAHPAKGRYRLTAHIRRYYERASM